MKASLVSVTVVATLAVAVSFLYVERSSPVRPVLPAAHAEGTRLLARMPVAFVPNLGQWEHGSRVVARVGAMTVFLEEKGWTFTLVERTAKQSPRRGSLDPMATQADLGQREKGEGPSARGVAVRMTFAGAGTPELVAEDQLPGRHNYFLGKDPAKWRSDVPLYSAVRYRGVHPGIDVRAREHDGHFEYDLLLQPGADLESVEIAVEGIERMHLDDAGTLVFETRAGPVHMRVPQSWEEGPSGERSPVACRYVLQGADRFGFDAPGRRTGWALVVDPGLVWSTFLGGTSQDRARAVALDAHGAATVAGFTNSTDFPATPGAFDTTYNGGIYDVFVTRVSPTGSSLVYSTFLGGTDIDVANALALDAQGAATVSGSTLSSDFPTTPGSFDTSFNGGFPRGDLFVTRLSPTGSSLVYSTFVGGTNNDEAHAVVVDAQGAVTVVGWTSSTDFPTTAGAFDTSYDLNGDAFVSRLSPTGSSLVYSTFLGATYLDDAVAVDAQGAATVVGTTTSTDFPTTPGAFDTKFSGGQDAFVTRLSPTGASLVYSTFLGGTGGATAYALALDLRGATTVAGVTGPDFPTTPGAFDTSYNGGGTHIKDVFITRLSPTGSSLVYSTYLGGTDEDMALALAVDAQGEATVAGRTTSTDFPTTPGAFATARHGGYQDAFVSRLSPTGSSLVYSTFLGGMGGTEIFGLALDAAGAATVVGWTSSTDFPTTPGAFDTSYNGSDDAFVTRLDLLPTGVSAFGRSSPSCAGPLAISVTSMPRLGNTGFALTCGNAPPNTTGVLALTGRRLASPVVVLGVEVWSDYFTRPSVPLPASSNQIGATEVLLPIPNDPALANVQLFAQFFWAGPTSPAPCPPLGVSASNALDITIQP